MNRTTLLIAASLACAAPFAWATPVHIIEKQCVKAAASVVQASVDDYAAYSTRPGAKFDVKIFLASLPLLTMVKSEVSPIAQDPSGLDAYVWMVFRPVTLNDGALYVRFLSRCTSRRTGEGADGSFDHWCAMLPESEHYGLNDFKSTLTVTERSGDCGGSTPTLLSYHLYLDSNTDHIEEIKQAVLGDGPVGALLGDFFNEKKFYQDYFTNYYRLWFSSL
jgi:hypothetical protein